MTLLTKDGTVSLSDANHRVTPRARQAVTEVPPAAALRLEREQASSEDDRLRSLKELVRFHEYDEALALARAVLKERPGDRAALACIDECLSALEALHIFSSTSVQKVPFAVISGTPLHALRLNHHAGFVLSLVDGFSPVSLILDICPMPRPDALRVIFGLLKDGILVFR